MSTEKECGAPAEGGPCVLHPGHNMGRLDVPLNHSVGAPETAVAYARGYDEGRAHGLHHGRRGALHDAAGEIHKQELEVLAVKVVATRFAKGTPE